MWRASASGRTGPRSPGRSDDDRAGPEELEVRRDEAAGRVVHEAPTVPRDWSSRERFAPVDSWSTVSAISEGLDALGDTVAGVLTAYSVVREDEVPVVETFGSQFDGRDDVPTDVQAAAADGT